MLPNGTIGKLILPKVAAEIFLKMRFKGFTLATGKLMLPVRGKLIG